MNQPAKLTAVAHYASDHEYYQDCIQWLKLRLIVEVERIRCSRGEDFREGFGGLYVSDEEVNEFLQEQIGDGHAPDSDKLTRLWLQIEQRKAATSGLKLQRIEALYDLMPSESFLLLLVFLPEIEPRLRKVFAYLHDDVQKKQASLALCQQLFPEWMAATDWHAILSHQEPLRRVPLVSFEGQDSNRLMQNLNCEDGVRSFLSGHPLPDECLAEQLRWRLPESTEAHLDVEYEDVVAPLLKLHQTHATIAQWPVVSIACNDTEHSLQVLSDALQMPVYSLALSTPVDSQKFSRMLRDAWLNDALPVVVWQGEVVDAEYDWMQQQQGWVMLHSADVQPIKFAALSLSWTPLSTDQQLVLWNEKLPAVYFELEDTDESLSNLVQQFQLTSSDIEKVCQQLALQLKWQQTAVSCEQIWQLCRSMAAAPIAKLAKHVSTAFRWSDLIVSDNVADELQSFQRDVRYSFQFIQQSAMDQVLGAAPSVSALFSGASGTGKTMAASVLANELGLDLFKIDLSRVVSKYIGETEKNLDRIFTAAACSRAILFFDEGDALFGKRSEVKDAHDRYANIEVSYLLQKIEEHPGCTIIATNFADNIDDAFSRRLEHIITFPMPGEDERRQIWQRINLLLIERDEDIDFDFLAQRFVLSGGHIRNCLIAACYQAKEQQAAVSMKHLLLAAIREYRKLKRPIKRTLLGDYYDVLMDA
ncbi:ATP-binding protein [Pleionea sp. CnH1-48]|uniref:ATP-binding protein n=1 Tax=Pleionea sp. CnH1-48 TaxID=2954494 RepID=UPI002098340E|nr:ATP-binding protein [Pleionea sp. CnH1-48]MCO7223317.1 ATP-binding protein [Pleionea sp. CnH1-48]